MLINLQIENIAVVERADIDFSAGFSVLSGETGAGKSIIIDALNAVIGGRVNRDLIRTGQSRAAVTALFSNPPDTVFKRAEELGVETEGDTLLIKREMTVDGKNICRINGRTVTLSMLRELGAFLVNIHGQHDGQHLLDEQFHIEYLDSYAGLEQALTQYQIHYEQLLQLNRQIKALSMDKAEKQRRSAELEDEIAELEAADVQENERESLTARRTVLMHMEKLVGALAEATLALDGDDDRQGVCALLACAEKSLRSAEKFSDRLKALAERADELSVIISDFSADVSSTLSEMIYSPQELEQVEMRLELLNHLERKYHIAVDELAGLLPALRQEFDSLVQSDQSLDDLKQAYLEKRKTVFELAQSLYQMRKAAAERLCTQIEEQLSQMDMPSARFDVEITTSLGKDAARFTRKGCDTVRFLLSANSGEDLKPLGKVASGGELSRMMLALRNVLAEGDQGITAVFDEVDAGVSGYAASKVGEKLFALSSSRQVLCVTHLPQIAALADQQYYISKQEREGRTYTTVEHLDRQGRIRELMRLTTGAGATDAAKHNADEMLRQADKRKEELLTSRAQ